MVLPVPVGVDAVVAALFNPLGAAAAAKEAGAAFVMVTGLAPRDADRLALASKFGADLAVDVAVDDPVAVLSKATGTMADLVVDVTAGAPAAFAQAVALAHPAGTVVVAGNRGFGGGAPGVFSRPGGIQGAARRRCSRRRCHCLSRRA